MKKITVLILSFLIYSMVACSPATTNVPEQTTATPNEDNALQPVSEELLEQGEDAIENISEQPESALTLDSSLSAEAVNMVTQSINHIIEFVDDSITPEDVTVISVEEVQWSDGSLGCPMDGMMYTQAIVPGYQIDLDINGDSYEVHTNTNSQVVLCTVNGERLTP